MSPALTPALVEATQIRSGAVRRLGMIGCTYVAAFAAAVIAWLMLNGVAASVWLVAPGLLVPAIALVLTLRSSVDARQYTMHVLVATMVLPIVLLFWSASFDLDGPGGASRSLAAGPTLDAQRLFSGAVAVQDSDLRSHDGPLLRAATFADGSELRLTRYADPQAAAAYLAMLASVFRGEPFSDGGRRAIRLQNASTGSTLVIVEQHAAELLELRARDQASGLARLAAQQVPVPGDAPPASPDADVRPSLPQWPFYTGAVVAHMLVFVGLIFWGGSALTQVPALTGSVAVPADLLIERLGSLARLSNRLIVSTPNGHSVLFELPAHQRRSHKITLWLDADRHAVQVEEKLAAAGAAPMDDNEASMGDFGESAFDATQPDAQSIWSSTWQATMIEPARLAGVPLQLQAASALLPASYLSSLDGEGVLTVLCAVVTRSGWRWEPRLLGARQRSSGRPT